MKNIEQDQLVDIGDGRLTLQMQSLEGYRRSSVYEDSFRAGLDLISDEISELHRGAERHATGYVRGVASSRVAVNHLLVGGLCDLIRRACVGVDPTQFKYDYKRGRGDYGFGWRPTWDTPYHRQWQDYMEPLQHFGSRVDSLGSNNHGKPIEMLEKLIDSTEYVQLVNEEQGSTRASILPVWVVGKDQRMFSDDQTAYIGATFDYLLPEAARNYRCTVHQLTVFEQRESWRHAGKNTYLSPAAQLLKNGRMHGLDGSRTQAYDAIDGLLSPDTPRLTDFGVFSFTGPAHLQRPKFTVADIEKLRCQGTNLFDMRPLAIANVVNPENISTVHDVAHVALTGFNMFKFDIPARLALLAEKHLGIASDYRAHSERMQIFGGDLESMAADVMYAQAERQLMALKSNPKGLTSKKLRRMYHIRKRDRDTNGLPSCIDVDLGLDG